MPIPSGPSDSELKLIKTIVKKSGSDISIDKLDLVEAGDHYDMYKITSAGKPYSLKFSFNHEDDLFLREIKNTKELNNPHTPKYIDGGVLKIGDKILYLLCEFHHGEAIMEIGRSQLIESIRPFIKAYKSLHYSGKQDVSYIVSINEFLDRFNLNDYMGSDQIAAINGHSDFTKIQSIVNGLKNEIKTKHKNLIDIETGCVLSDTNPSHIFIDRGVMHFDDLRHLSNGHAFADLANMIISFSIGKQKERTFVKEISESLDIPFDWNLYQQFYQLELAKKALSYVFRYLKEVYLYESQRPYEILRIIDEFSLAYERMCKIPIFKEHKEFIRRNITEPVLEQGPRD